MTSDIAQANNVRLYPSVANNGNQPSGSIKIVTTDPSKSPTQITYAPTTQTQTTPCVDTPLGSPIVTKLFYTESWDASRRYTSGGKTIDGAVHTKHRYKLVFTSGGVDTQGNPNRVCRAP